MLFRWLLVQILKTLSWTFIQDLPQFLLGDCGPGSCCLMRKWILWVFIAASVINSTTILRSFFKIALSRWILRCLRKHIISPKWMLRRIILQVVLWRVLVRLQCWLPKPIKSLWRSFICVLLLATVEQQGELVQSWWCHHLFLLQWLQSCLEMRVRTFRQEEGRWCLR